MPGLRRPLATAALAAAAVVGPAAGTTAGTTVGTTAAAAPAPCPTVTVQDATRQADAVFSGTVEDVARSGSAGATRFDHQVTVTRVWKGGLATEQVEVRTTDDRAADRRCAGLGALEAGEDYLFFVDRRAGSWVAGGSSRTAAVSDRLLEQVTRLLGAGTAPVAPAPETAEFTRVADSEPASLTRTAAPGLAMVILGLLGLAVVRRLGRR